MFYRCLWVAASGRLLTEGGWVWVGGGGGGTGANGNCATTNSGTFHKPKYEKSVDFSGTAPRSRSSQHVSMRYVNCTVSNVF